MKVPEMVPRGVLSELASEVAHGHDAYGEFLKPRVADMLATVGLDVSYERAEGDRIWYRDAEGTLVEVLDMLGGYGAGLTGHNHPLLLDRAIEVLQAKRPFLAQASIRSLAGRLAQRLSERVGATTGRRYVATLAATGAEAVEAAIKHAELELLGRARSLAESNRSAQAEARTRLRDGASIELKAGLRRASELLGERVTSLDMLFDRVKIHNEARMSSRPVLLALAGGFHGKTTGALSLTENASYREKWQRVALHTRFVRMGDTSAFLRAIDDATTSCVALALEDDALLVTERRLANVAAIFVEPIQGEGGVREVEAGFLRELRALADVHRIPLVLDEIQCGMGRTGTFLASERLGVRGDYYLFSKSLGGGLAKVSAMLVDSERYDREFGYLHTSTFAEDDFSSAIGLGVLDLLEADGGAMMKQCAEKGRYLLGALRKVQERYPKEIRDVRGRGLMIGVEFARQTASPSNLLRVVSDQDLLGYLLAGYLLRAEKIRVAPTLSSPETLRIQPSAFVDLASLDRVVSGVARVAKLLHTADARRLVRHLVPKSRPALSPSPPRSIHPLPERPTHGTHVAFLGHFLDARDVADWDSAFAGLPDRQCEELLERTRAILDPFVTDRVVVRSADGSLVHVTIIGVLFTAAQVIESFRVGDTAWARAAVEQGVALAREEGCTLVGFGGYTSIVTDNCRTVLDGTLALTTGNALTAVAALESVKSACARRGIEQLDVAVVGALGNIGSVLADAILPDARSVVLVGRGGGKGMQRRLDLRRQQLYVRAWELWEKDPGAGGVMAILAKTELAKGWKTAPSSVPTSSPASELRRLRGDEDAFAAKLVELLDRELGVKSPIRVASDLSALRSANVVLTATNAPTPILHGEHFGKGPVVVCDVAAPGDVDPRALGERSDVTFLAGGMVRLPLGQTVRVHGMPLEGNQIYGCLAETILLGLAGKNASTSFGRLDVEQLDRVRALAHEHGFGFEEQALDASQFTLTRPKGAVHFLGEPSFDLAEAGKKAAHLHRLTLAGARVPPGFVVFSDVVIEELDDDAWGEAVAHIGGFPVAVRSSGLLEDLEGASFAGLYESYLNVDTLADLKDRIRACRASGATDRVRTYQEKQGLADQASRVSVLVQRMVPATVAGVAFSIHPMTGLEEHALVECCMGLGEKLVSGQITPTRYVLTLDSGAIVEETLGSDGAALSPVMRASLCDVLLDVQAHFGTPQDVEWAIDPSGALYVLQSRAVTKVHYRTDVDEFTNADFKDGGISARVCTPMMYSLYRDAMQVSMQEYFVDIKLIDAAAPPAQWIAYYYGRGYWNASAVKRALSKVPGFNEEKFDRDLGIQKDYGSGGPLIVPTNVYTVANAVPVAVAVELHYSSQLKRVARFGAAFPEKYRRHRARCDGFASVDDVTFFRHLTDVLEVFHPETERAYFTTIYDNSNAQSDFKTLLGKIEEATGHPIAPVAFMGGLADVHHMDVQRGYLTLYGVAQAEGFDGAPWSAALERFLGKYGFHADAELDMTVPRWDERPERVREMVESMLRSGGTPADPDATVRRQQAKYQEAVDAVEASICRRLTHRVRYLSSFRRQLQRSRTFLSAREQMREYSTQCYAIVRRYLVEAGIRLARQSKIASADDVFMLLKEEVGAVVTGSLSLIAARARIRSRRRMYDGYRAFVPPNELGRGVAQRHAASHVRRDGGRAVLVGLGCSPGVIEGVTRVVTSLDEIHTIEKGDILVTKFTDPAWTPVLGLVAGIVTEVGGMLSHAAVIGREYGIPAVLNLPGATIALKSGQRVRVDGTTGEVEIL